MTEEFSTEEAVGRMVLAAREYVEWPTEELWDEFGLLTDEAWGETTPTGDPEPVKWAQREAIGLALIDRGATLADLQRGYPQTGSRA